MVLSDALFNQIVKQTIGILEKRDIDKIIKIINHELSQNVSSKETETNVMRLFNSIFSLSQFLKDALVYSHFLPSIIRIVANSNYLTDILVRDSSLIYWLLLSRPQYEKVDEMYLEKEIHSRCRNLKNYPSKLRVLKGIKRREILGIAYRDICGFDNLKETTIQLSILTKVILNQLFIDCIKQKLEEYCIKKLSTYYFLIALGKLGGDEINYSSDADMMLVYEKDEELKKGLTSQEFFSSVIQTFIRTSTENNEDGFLYRIDFRLRPYGKDSSLCRSLSNTFDYYETESALWERQMLIKSSYLCGNKNLYREFSEFTSKLIYQLPVLSSPHDYVAKMRAEKVGKLRDSRDIKESRGGIRDIEFPVQLLQLLNGKRNPKIKTGNTISALKLLNEKDIITDDEHYSMLSAYILFRKIEHYLQLMNNNQTHRIPETGEIIEKISIYLEYASVADFSAVICEHKKRVTEFARSVLMETEKFDDNVIDVNFSKMWEKEKKFLKSGKGILGSKFSDLKTEEIFLKIEGYLDEFLKQAIDPERTINNFVKIIRKSNFPSIWYDLFCDLKIFNYFLTICERSQKAADILAEDRSIRDAFLNGIFFKTISEKTFQFFEPKWMLFDLMTKFANKIINSEKVGVILSHYLSKKITDAINNSLDEAENRLYKRYLLFLSMGSFSTGEMSFNSDIDIIILYSKEQVVHRLEERMFKLLSDLQKLLFPVKVDCRLRPEGQSGNLVWSIRSFSEYLKNRSRIWEFQSYTRMNLLSGSKQKYSIIRDEIINSIKNQSHEKIKSGVKDIRMKNIDSTLSFNIKSDSGGIRESEIIVQYILLTNPDLLKEFHGKNTKEILEKIGDKFLNFQDDAEILLRNRKFLIDLQLTFQNYIGSSGSLLPTDDERMKALARICGLSDETSLQNKIKNTRKENSTIFRKTVEINNWIKN